MKKKLTILGSSYLLQSVNIEDLSKKYNLVTSKIELSLVSLMSHSIMYDKQKLMSGADRKLVSRLLSEYEKDGLNDLIASNPDIIILDFYEDIQFGVSETLLGSYITNNIDVYAKNPSFEMIRTIVDYNPVFEFDLYAHIWYKALKNFMSFINTYLPKTNVIIYENLEILNDYLISNGSNLLDDSLDKIWQKFNQYASQTYDLPIISDLVEIDLSSDDVINNNIYDVNLIRNATFDNKGEFWTSLGNIPFDDANTNVENGELTLFGNRDQMGTFSFSSAPIYLAASPENPVELVLNYEILVEDVFDIEIYHDYVFIGRGFDEKLHVTHSDAIQKFYDQQAKLLNLTSGKWKKIKKILTVTTPYLRVGPDVKGKTTVKWRNLSLKHFLSDEK